VDLLEGSGGIFDVKRDGVLVFSKKQAGRHAHAGEVVQLLDSNGADR
jgi:hypothetical protein